MKRNPYLTEGMAQVLRMIDASAEKELAETVDKFSGGWWAGDTEVSASVCVALLRLCLIKMTEDSTDTFRRYTITEDGRGVMEDPNYVPRIIIAIRERK